MTGYSFSGSLEDCKRYCRKDCVVVETHRVRNGFDITFRFRMPSWYFEFYRRASCIVIFGSYINWSKSFTDKPGKVVYDPQSL